MSKVDVVPEDLTDIGKIGEFWDRKDVVQWRLSNNAACLFSWELTFFVHQDGGFDRIVGI
jgi:hypothetical protein